MIYVPHVTNIPACNIEESGTKKFDFNANIRSCSLTIAANYFPCFVYSQRIIAFVYPVLFNNPVKFFGEKNIALVMVV